MVDIKEKIKELCKNHIEDSLVESFLNKYSSNTLYDSLIKDMFVDADNYDIDDNYSLSIWKYDNEEIEYTLLDYTNTTDESGQPEELNKFTLKIHS